MGELTQKRPLLHPRDGSVSERQRNKPWGGTGPSPSLPVSHCAGLPQVSKALRALICTPRHRALSRQQTDPQALRASSFVGLHPPPPTGGHGGCEIAPHVSPKRYLRHSNGRNAKARALGKARQPEDWEEVG